MALPRVKFSRGPFDLDQLRKLGVVPHHPSFDSLGQPAAGPLSPKQIRQQLKLATQKTQVALENLGQRAATAASGKAAAEMATLEKAEALSPVKSQIAAITAQMSAAVAQSKAQAATLQQDASQKLASARTQANLLVQKEAGIQSQVESAIGSTQSQAQAGAAALRQRAQSLTRNAVNEAQMLRSQAQAAALAQAQQLRQQANEVLQQAQSQAQALRQQANAIVLGGQAALGQAEQLPDQASQGLQVLQSNVANGVQKFQNELENARTRFQSAASEAANLERSLAGDAMNAASAQLQSDVVDAVAKLTNSKAALSRLGPVNQIGQVLDQGNLSSDGISGSLSQIAGSLPGGGTISNALNRADQAISMGDQVDFDALLSGGPPELDGVADALDQVQDIALQGLMDDLPPQVQQILSVSEQVLGALGVTMPSLSSLAGLKSSDPPSVGEPGCYVEGQMIATILNETTHGTPTMPGPGALTVLCNCLPVWRILIDFHMCPIVKGVIPDVGGVVMMGAMQSIAEGMLIARQGDEIIEIPGGPNPIILLGEYSGDSDSDDDDSDAPDQPETPTEGPSGPSEDVSQAPTDNTVDGTDDAPASQQISDEDAAAPAPIPTDPMEGGSTPSKIGDMDITSQPNGDVQVGNNITIKADPDDPAYQDKVLNNLNQINQTPTGNAMLQNIDNSPNPISIEKGDSATSGNGCSYDDPAGRFQSADGTPGAGTATTVSYNPDNTTIGSEPWETRPPGVGLAHELVHADQASNGVMMTGTGDNDGLPDPSSPDGTAQANIRELQAAGIPPYDNNPYNENKIRSEWNPPQPQRQWY